MLRATAAWLRGHKAIASAVAIALVAAIPVGAAVFHKGFPLNDVNLDAQDVWVTNGEKLLGARLNHQINELDAAVSGASDKLDVLQDGGGAYFLTDTAHGSLERIDPAYVSLVDRVTIPVDSQLSYGANTLAILAPNGKLWVLDTSSRLDFDPLKTKVAAKIGTKSQVVVTKSGSVFAVSASKKLLYSIDHVGAEVHKSSFPGLKNYQLSAVGNEPVVLDNNNSKSSILTEDGSSILLPVKGLQIQQPGEQNSYVLLSSGSGLLEVSLDGGDVKQIAAGISSPVTAQRGVSAPVWLNGCAYGAWADAKRYLYACDDRVPKAMDIEQQVSGDDLKFRVNGDVIALNNVRDGNAWVVSSSMRLVQNWAMLKPNTTEVKGKTGEERPVVQSFSDTLATRSKTNRPPVATDDDFGVRAGRSTVLPVLSNDTDQDGDVLTITAVSGIPKKQGRLDVIGGGRAIQFTPAESVSGSISFRYTIDDGRGGTDTAQVNAAVHSAKVNTAPKSTRSSATEVEVGQIISYNVLNDWIDPDGDNLSLTLASSTTGDDVRYSPDGNVTFTSKTGRTGSKEVKVTVSDGHLSTTGVLKVTVKSQGSLSPIATPDYVSGFAGDALVVHPLENDVSPSGDTLTLVGAAIEDGSADASVRVDADKGTVTVTPPIKGEFYITYTLGAGSQSTVGLIRVNAAESGVEAPPIAVTDVAYVRPGESTTVNVLDNDVSPTGRVLAVRSVDRSNASDLNVEVLDNAVVKITAPTVLPEQVQLRYVVSDGSNNTSAGITVVPIPPLVSHQPPVAVDDAQTVRAGDIASVTVLDNDYSPDNATFSLSPALVSAKDAGSGATAFVSGKLVRYQAPNKPGQYSVVYGVHDKHGQKAQARVTFNVTAPSTKTNQAPEPRPLTIRAFSGSAVPVTVPLSGIDPDGDSVSLQGIVDEPTLGRIAGSSNTSFTYQAYPGMTGTNTFTYKVTDTYGKSATGTVRVGVIARPSVLAPPSAVNDTVEVKPGKTASVPVLANDSDPNGYTIALEKKLPEVDAGLKASVHGKVVLLTAPKKEGVYMIRYQVTNGQGGQASAYVQVLVSSKAKPKYPTAIDHFVTAKDVAGKSTATVDVLADATNPSGLVGDLTVKTSGSNASKPTVRKDGTVKIPLGDKRMIITYSLTDPETELSAKAFIIVPPDPKSDSNPKNKNDDQKKYKVTAPPHLTSGLGEQIVEMDGSKTWSLSSLITVPSGRQATLTGASGVAATNSNGQSSFVNDHTVRFTPQKGYRGPATLTFAVDDRKEEGASKNRVTTLVLPIVVGNPDQSDVSPTFTPPKTIELEPGEKPTTLDLRSSSFHPNPDILSSLKYQQFSNPNSNIDASLSGSKLTLAAPLGVKIGETTRVTFTVKSSKFAIDGYVNAKVVSSSRPVAQQKDVQKNEVQRGNTISLKNATGEKYWVNPFPGKPLTITKAWAASAPSGVTIAYTGSSISVSVGSGAAIGSVNIQYTVEDATKDPQRTKATIGQYEVTIHDVPAKPDSPGAASNGDSSAKVTISRQPATNGKPINKYEIFANGKSVATPTKIGTSAINGLTNGTAYTFTVRAHNADGWGATSSASGSVTPYGTPATPRAPTIKASGYAPANLTWSWSSVDTKGGLKTYEWELSNKKTGKTTSTSASTGGASVGKWKARVRVQNKGNKWSSWSAWSSAVTVEKKPPPPPPDPVKPSAVIVKGATTNGMHYLCARFSDIKPGNYTVTGLINGGSGWSSPRSVKGLPANGTVCTYGFLGKRNSDTIGLKISGKTNLTPTTNSWDSLSHTSNNPYSDPY